MPLPGVVLRRWIPAFAGDDGKHPDRSSRILRHCDAISPHSTRTSALPENVSRLTRPLPLP